MKKYNLLIQAVKIFILTSLLFVQAAYSSPISNQAQRSLPREPQEITIKINSVDSTFAVTRILDADLPTLILLPGIYRGFLKNEEILKVLSRRKINWVAWHSTRHPEAIVNGTQNPWLRQATSQSLADELIILKQALNIKNPILVSLSYSSSIIPYVDPKIFPVVIETAPMGIALENNPPAPYYESWRQWMGMFPIFGDVMIQSQEYWAYRGFWLQQAAGLTKTHKHYEAKQSAIAEGLAQLAYAGRSFDLREQDFSKGPKRFWIIGQKENRNRKAIQSQAISLYEKQTGERKSAYEVADAGHIIPNENPVEYVKIISQLVKKMSR